jgi:hypothetical protein
MELLPLGYGSAAIAACAHSFATVTYLCTASVPMT